MMMFSTTADEELLLNPHHPDLIQFHKDAFCFDIHIHGKDIFSRPFQWLSRLSPFKRIFYPLHALSVLRWGGVDGGGLSVRGDLVFTHLPPPPGGLLHRVSRGLHKAKKDVTASKGRIVFTSQEIRQARQDNVLSFVLGVEGAGPVEECFENLKHLFHAGVRVLTIVHLNDNSIGTVPVDFTRYWVKGAQKKQKRGLTPFGEKVIKNMNDLGMIIDLAHADSETVMDVTSLTTMPIIASHTGARNVSDFHRYITDEEIAAIANTGGIIGMWPMYFIGKGMKTPQDFIAHVKHILAVGGEDSIAIGTDFQGMPGYMKGYTGITDMCVITQLLFQMGLNETQVRKILGLNFLRVLKEVTGR